MCSHTPHRYWSLNDAVASVCVMRANGLYEWMTRIQSPTEQIPNCSTISLEVVRSSSPLATQTQCCPLTNVMMRDWTESTSYVIYARDERVHGWWFRLCVHFVVSFVSIYSERNLIRWYIRVYHMLLLYTTSSTTTAVAAAHYSLCDVFNVSTVLLLLYRLIQIHGRIATVWRGRWWSRAPMLLNKCTICIHTFGNEVRCVARLFHFVTLLSNPKDEDDDDDHGEAEQVNNFHSWMAK